MKGGDIMDIVREAITCLEDRNMESDAEISLLCYPPCCGSTCWAIL